MDRYSYHTCAHGIMVAAFITRTTLYTTTMIPCALVSWREWGILAREGYNKAFLGDPSRVSSSKKNRIQRLVHVLKGCTREIVNFRPPIAGVH